MNILIGFPVIISDSLQLDFLEPVFKYFNIRNCIFSELLQIAFDHTVNNVGVAKRQYGLGPGGDVHWKIFFEGHTEWRWSNRFSNDFVPAG